jgi:MoxR-like ATPase
MLAKSLARAVGGTYRRVQFTPDLLPADVTGVSIFNQKTGEFEFRPGPVFTNVLLADEINRATPKTQSSLKRLYADILDVLVDRHVCCLCKFTKIGNAIVKVCVLFKV